ncbi:hypothetical protein ABB37_08423 [Leptomonas pyrrhocoris]|uniref:Zinc finger protein n=1 Tax=Leptomonas pyrrhocoris TaxID=157538 RepID=A0A0N0VDM9_LEPPY|nr:hypothetical protein ABB37_08423 [Leptomonas pyrrhocoris]KPA75532.1 hypothetical protein ABB37_08423 [Leptomonas pyrrhocoris]|eukprot:XP_015653971.1 hypothetical protein ABB37_08423 [Leptomonas pyrrhocoris]
MSSSLPPRQFTMVPGQDIDPLFLCPLCHDSWADPVELVPCGDIFCHACVRAARAQHAAQPMIMENFQCPQCHTVVQSEKKPNRMLLNTVLEVEVECRYCGQRCSRAASAHHECPEGTKQKALEEAAAAAAVVPSSPQLVTSSSATVELNVGTSTAPSPSRAQAPRRASGSSSRAEDLAVAPPAPRGPRRAVQEIEGAFAAIEDDPTSTTFRTRSRVQTVEETGGEGEAGGTPHTAALTTPLYPELHVVAPPASAAQGSAPSPATGTSGPTAPDSALRTAEPWRYYGLTQLEYDQLVGLFVMFDEGTGRLNQQQLRDLCFCMNFVQREEDVKVVFRAMDGDRLGYVTQDAFLLWLSHNRPDPSVLFGLTEFEYTDAILQFRSADPEYNGIIDANEFCALCLTNGYAGTPEEAMRYFHLCDERHTGYVSLLQFLSNLKTIQRIRSSGGNGNGNGSGGGNSTGAPWQSQQQQQQEVPMPRVVGNAPTGTQSPLGNTALLRSTNSSYSMYGSGGGDGRLYASVGDNPLGSPFTQHSGYRSPYPERQSSMHSFLSAGGPVASPSMSQCQQMPQQHQPFLSMPSSLPGDVQHQQHQQQQQPYSQMGRSTTPNVPPLLRPQDVVQQQGKAQKSRSRLHRPSARPQRDEECALM